MGAPCPPVPTGQAGRAAKPGGRPRSTDLREVLNALSSWLRSGGAWHLLPHDFPPWKTLYPSWRAWRLSGEWERIHAVLRERTRQRAGRERTRQRGHHRQPIRQDDAKGGPANSAGYDGGKQVKGRTRHRLVETLGLVVKALVHPAGPPRWSTPLVHPAGPPRWSTPRMSPMARAARAARAASACLRPFPTAPPSYRPAASAPPVGRRRLSRGGQRRGRADAGLDGRGRQAPRALALGGTRAGAAGGAAGLGGAAAPLGRRKDVRLAGPLAPHQQGRRVPAADLGARHLPGDDPHHAPPACRNQGKQPFQTPSRRPTSATSRQGWTRWRGSEGAAPPLLAHDQETPRAPQRLRPILRYPDTTHADHRLEQFDQRDTHLALHHTFHVAW